MFEFFAKLFDTEGFTPRWWCGDWSPEHGWLHILSDLGTWSAYTAIPLVLIYFIQHRRDVPFRSIFVLFGAFILLCGLTHLIEVFIFWIPVYRFAGLVKFLTAVVSWATVVALVRILPNALDLPGILKLNEQLRKEIKERQMVEQEREALLQREQTARASAERANRMKDDFLSTVSHEIRTPLNAILGWAQILRNTEVSATEIEQGLEVIERNSRVQTKLVDDLLEMSRIISGKVQLDVQTVDLAAIVRSAIQSIRPAAAAKDIQLNETTDPTLVGLVGDPDRLQQIVWNLLSNAIKFTPKGGTVAIHLDRHESDARITIKDSGIGISADFLPFVFDRFRQGEGGTTRRFGGLGLGLAIVKQLTELHGGSVEVASEGEGMGATFTVRLPIKSLTSFPTTGDPQGAAESREGELPRLDSARILIVDNEPDSLDLVQQVLRGAGGEVIAARSADEALKLFDAKGFDLLVSDIGMPNRDGYELIREVRSRSSSACREIPAIALTAFARSEDRRRVLLAGFQAHLVKPAEPGELVTLAASLLGRLRS